jgi:hypothetical protein
VRFGEEAPRGDAVQGLETCERALARITAAWPKPQVLEVIEELLYGPPAALGGFPSLQAWRDLLWLHGLAEDTMLGAPAPARAADEHPEMTLDKLHAMDFQPGRERFGMDVSLADVDRSLHRVVDQQHVPKLPPVPDLKFLAPTLTLSQATAEKPRSYEDFLDAVGAAEGRALHVR